MFTHPLYYLMPHGVGNEFLLPPDDAVLKGVRAKYALPSEYAFYPTNTWPHKNHATLLQSLHLLSKKYDKRLACVFTGVERGGHEAFLKAAQELGLTEAVRLLGSVEKRDMSLLYRSASLLIFPSLFEGFGLPPLEAMASDCPVVCSNVASIPEVVGDAALLCNPYDPEAIADAMHRVLTDEELRRALVQAGRERCRQFSWQRTVRETLKVLEEAASIGAQPRRRLSWPRQQNSR